MKLPILIIMILISIGTVCADPTLDSYNPDLFITTPVTGSINHSVNITNTSSLTYYWLLDGVDQSNQAEFLIVTYSEIGNSYLEFYASDGASNTTPITWTILSTREMATGADVKSTFNETPIDTILDSIDGKDPDVREFFWGVSLPYINVIGNFYFLFLYFVPLMSIWISQRNLLIPVGISVIFGVLMIGALPEVFVGPAYVIILLTSSGIIYKFAKGR